MLIFGKDFLPKRPWYMKFFEKLQKCLYSFHVHLGNAAIRLSELHLSYLIIKLLPGENQWTLIVVEWLLVNEQLRFLPVYYFFKLVP
jgi:hypothetical protein